MPYTSFLLLIIVTVHGSSLLTTSSTQLRPHQAKAARARFQKGKEEFSVLVLGSCMGGHKFVLSFCCFIAGAVGNEGTRIHTQILTFVTLWLFAS